MKNKVDKIDLKIIDELLRNAKLTNVELAERVSLTPTPCLRRTKRLERDGVIERYTVLVDKEAIGLNISAFVFVKLEKHTNKQASLFENDLKRFPNITEFYVVSGEYDYILKVNAKDLKDYDRFMKEELSTARGISNLSSTIILSQPRLEYRVPDCLRY